METDHGMAAAETTNMNDQELALIVLQQGKPQQVLAKFLNLTAQLPIRAVHRRRAGSGQGSFTAE